MKLSEHFEAVNLVDRVFLQQDGIIAGKWTVNLNDKGESPKKTDFF